MVSWLWVVSAGCIGVFLGFFMAALIQASNED